MDTDKMRKLLDELAAFMDQNNLAELEIDLGGTEVKLKKAGNHPPPPIIHQGPAVPNAAPPASAPSAAAPAGSQEEPGTVAVKSPMVGTFYRASKPESDPYTEVGEDVTEDSVLCIIEAMKVMNEIKAEHKGRVAKILVENGDPVEYGQTLFLIAP